MIRIALSQGKTAFVPGERIDVRLSWSFDVPAESLALRLLWYTDGKGTQDVEVVEERIVSPQSRGGEEQLSFSAPKFPFSIHGQLLSIRWAFEAIVRPGNESAREEITIGRNGEAVVLPETPDNSLKKLSNLMKSVARFGQREKTLRP